MFLSVALSVATESVVDETNEKETEPMCVYEGAIEDFLLPIEEFSWERKEEPTHIMIHFTSAIGVHPEDPYNIEYIRDIFV